jgi:hypothetical protein
MDFSSLLVTLESRSAKFLGPCLSQLLGRYAAVNTVSSGAKCVFVLEHEISLKSFAAVREVFSTEYPDK